MAAIEASAAYLPPWRAPKGDARVLWFDEDATTLCVEAARRLPRADAGEILVAAPAPDAVDAAVLADALGAPRDAVRVAAGADPAKDAYRRALQATEMASHAVLVLVVRTDDPSASAHRFVPGPGTPDMPGAQRVADPRVRGGEVRVLDEKTVAAAEAYRSTGGRVGSVGAYVSDAAYAASTPARYRLIGTRCRACGHLDFPPRGACGACGGDVGPHAFRPAGKVYARTVIGKGAAPTEFLEQQEHLGAYGVAIVELEEGPRIALQLTDTLEPEKVRIGDPVRIVLRRLYFQDGRIRYGAKASVVA